VNIVPCDVFVTIDVQPQRQEQEDRRLLPSLCLLSLTNHNKAVSNTLIDRRELVLTDIVALITIILVIIAARDVQARSSWSNG
jgi:hypothetical protein